MALKEYEKAKKHYLEAGLPELAIELLKNQKKLKEAIKLCKE